MSHVESGAAGDASASGSSSSNATVCQPRAPIPCASANSPRQYSANRTWRVHGRAIRRLVTLTDNIHDLINEADRRGSLGRTDACHTEEETRLFTNYNMLLKHIPEIGDCIADPAHAGLLDCVVKELSGGADSARADDAASLKTTVVTWLTEIGSPEPRLSLYDKAGRGFHNDSTAKLICPVDYDWGNAEHRQNILDWHPEFLVTANSWLQFLYEDGRFDRTNPAEGLFKGKLLVRAFKLIFTSPSSSEDVENPGPGSTVPPLKRPRGERRTRSHVARLLNMTRVEPRAIAYTAVQVRFALSGCGSWRLVDELFDYVDFYQNIVKWFEETNNQEDKEFVDKLLLWWNRQVFGRKGIMDYAPQSAENMSVMTSFKRRRTGGPGN